MRISRTFISSIFFGLGGTITSIVTGINMELTPVQRTAYFVGVALMALATFNSEFATHSGRKREQIEAALELMVNMIMDSGQQCSV